MRRSRLLVPVAALSLLTTLGMTGCSGHSTVAWEDSGTPVHNAPDQSWWQYEYVYHPESQVYFEPYSTTFYWYNGQVWQSGQELPDWVAVNPDNAVTVRMATKEPYAHHERAVALHGPLFGAYPSSMSTKYPPNVARALAEAKRQEREQAQQQEFQDQQLAKREPPKKDPTKPGKKGESHGRLAPQPDPSTFVAVRPGTMPKSVNSSSNAPTTIARTTPPTEPGQQQQMMAKIAEQNQQQQQQQQSSAYATAESDAPRD
jgi:hypothetical protein